MWILESVLTFTSAVWDVLDRRNTVLGLRSQIKAAAGPISPIFMVAFFNPVVNIVEEVVINVAITVKILPIEERIMRDEYRQIVMDQGLRPQSNNMNDLVDQVSVLVKKSPNEVFSLGTTNILPVLCNHHEKMVRVIEEKLPPQEKNFAYSEIFGNPSLGSWFSDKDCTIDNGEITGIALMKTEYPTDLHCIGFVYGLNGTCNGPRKGPQTQSIMLEQGEIITHVQGEVENYVGKLMFHTNRGRRLGTYSKEMGDGKPFSFSIPGYHLAFINGTWSSNHQFFSAIQFVWTKTDEIEFDRLNSGREGFQKLYYNTNEGVQGETLEITLAMVIENSTQSESAYSPNEYKTTGQEGEL